jgi:hypothetical protein
MSNFEKLDEAEELEFEFMLNPAEPLVLLLGWVDHEGILSSLKSSNRQYKKKFLDSLPENWTSISKIFEEFNVSCTLAKFTPHVVRLVTDPKYQSVREELFDKIGNTPNQFFIFEDLLEGEQTNKLREQSKPYPPAETTQAAITWMRSKNVKLVPYKRNAEVTVLAAAFLGDIERSLIFRLYVPAGRIWSNEADKFLQLFRDYLAKVDKLSVRLDQRRTDFGVIYEFHGELPNNAIELPAEFQNFSTLMDLCALDVEAASHLLSSKNLNPNEISAIITRYSKEARRLQLDIKQEAESKSLSIRHRLEAELLDLAPNEDDWHQINALLSIAVPRPETNTLRAPFSAFHGSSNSNITLNIRPQFIQAVNNVVAQEIYGNQHFSQEHHQLIELIGKHGGNQKDELETAVHEIADHSGKQIDKLRATQLIKGFLIEAAKKTGDIGIGILQTYIEKQLGL